MMGRQTVDQSQLFYLFNLESRIPARHLPRRINPTVTRILAEFREKLEPFYSEVGRPSIDPELMIRMLIVGYCYGIRFERRLCEEVELHLAYRWFCRLDLDDKVPDHSTFSVNRHGRFRDSDLFRQVFEAVVRACMDAGLRPSHIPKMQLVEPSVYTPRDGIEPPEPAWKSFPDKTPFTRGKRPAAAVTIRRRMPQPDQLRRGEPHRPDVAAPCPIHRANRVAHSLMPPFRLMN
jgi:transposase